MPCYEPPYEPTPAERAKQRRLDAALHRLACDRCRSFEAAGFVVPEWAQEWWMEHRKEDMKRIIDNPKFLEEEEQRMKALAKLTKEELVLLGLL